MKNNIQLLKERFHIYSNNIGKNYLCLLLPFLNQYKKALLQYCEQKHYDAICQSETWEWELVVRDHDRGYALSKKGWLNIISKREVLKVTIPPPEALIDVSNAINLLERRIYENKLPTQRRALSSSTCC